MHEQDAIADCQRTLKVFKFKKYIKGYEDGKRRASPKHSLDIGSFLKGEGYDPLEGGATHATEVEASLNAPSRNVVPPISGLLLTAFDAERVADVSSVMVGVTSPILHPMTLHPRRRAFRRLSLMLSRVTRLPSRKQLF